LLGLFTWWAYGTRVNRSVFLTPRNSDSSFRPSWRPPTQMSLLVVLLCSCLSDLCSCRWPHGPHIVALLAVEKLCVKTVRPNCGACFRLAASGLRRSRGHAQPADQYRDSRKTPDRGPQPNAEMGSVVDARTGSGACSSAPPFLDLNYASLLARLSARR
jgi:hypothetical protein